MIRAQIEEEGESPILRPTATPTNCLGSTATIQTEKANHYHYLKGFRVEQCAQFLQHKCTSHKPFTCFDWHFMNQRRRRPVRKRDGTFNYSPDTYCTKYDETTGVCPEKDECPYLHRTAGDTERRYHLRYYKTGICVYDTDPRGYCVKNGQHCAFAHGSHDLRNPVYDAKELQSMSVNGRAEDAPDTTALLLNAGPANVERERNALNEDPRWNETAYVLANYKTELCKRPPRLCRQGYACPQYHNSKDRRRTPKKFKYRSTPCPNTKQGDEWGDPASCEQGESCPYCHTRTEQQFHPEIYKSTKCNDMQQSGYCPRGPFCAFAHNEDEMVSTRDIDLDLINTDTPANQFLKNNMDDSEESNLIAISPPNCHGPIARPRSYSHSHAPNYIRQSTNHSILTDHRLQNEIFKLSKCRDIPRPPGYDSRNPFCVFSHNEEDLITNRNIDLVDTVKGTPAQQLLGAQLDEESNTPIMRSTASPTNCLGPIARPRSYSHSHARMIGGFSGLHAAIAERSGLLDDSKLISNPIGLQSHQSILNSDKLQSSIPASFYSTSSFASNSLIDRELASSSNLFTSLGKHNISNDSNMRN